VRATTQCNVILIAEYTRGCVRGRGYRECGYILLLLLLWRDVSGAAGRVTVITAAGRSGFRGFFSSTILHERGDHGRVVFAVDFFSTPRFGFLSRLRCALCKTRLRKTHSHSDLLQVKCSRRMYCVHADRAVCNGRRYIKFSGRYNNLDVWFLRTKSSSTTIYRCPTTVVEFENVLKKTRVRCRRNFVTI